MEKEHILSVLRETKSAVKKENIVKLKNLSNQTIHSASIQQDPDSIAIAVIIYSLSKIIERKKYTYYKEWPKFHKIYLESIDEAIKALQENKTDVFRKHINEIRREIGKLSGYGKVNRLVKTKRGFADIIFERKNKKIIIEIKDYQAKDISVSQVKQLNKYLDDCDTNLGILICHKKPKKDTFLIGKNKIIILEKQELCRIPEIMG